MARKVKCVDTGEYSTNDIAWKAPNGKYYSTQDAYEKETISKENYKKCIEYLADLSGYKKGMVMNTAYTKGLSALKNYGYDVVLETIILNNDTLQKASQKEFSSDYGKARYLMTIISNSINDVYKLMQRKNKSDAYEQRVSKDIGDTDIANKNIIQNDVSNLLGDLWT